MPISAEEIWQQVTDLTERVFPASSGVDVPRGDHWNSLVTVSLTQANARLNSIRKLLLDQPDWDSSVILTRSLFELAANMSYIAKDVEKRLPQYLKHGGIPLTKEEAEQLQQEIKENPQPVVRDIVPGRAWKSLRDMCTDLGPDWLKEYETFYTIASVPTHAGSFMLGENYKQLLEQLPPTTHEKAAVLASALSFHLRVASILASVFPKEIKPEAIKKLRFECQDLGQSLANDVPPV